MLCRGLMRLRLFRAWVQLPQRQQQELATMRARLRGHALASADGCNPVPSRLQPHVFQAAASCLQASALRRWLDWDEEAGYEGRMLESFACVALRARAVCTLPLLALRLYARCRALVRSRSYALMLLDEVDVPPLPPLLLPVRGGARPEVALLLTQAVVADRLTRLIHRMRRARLAPLLLHVLRRHVLRRRRKRWAAASGERSVLRRVVQRWLRFVLDDLNDTDDDEDDDDDDDDDDDGGSGGGRAPIVGAGHFPTMRHFAAQQRGPAMRTYGLYLKQRHGFLEPSDHSDTGRLVLNQPAARRASLRSRRAGGGQVREVPRPRSQACSIGEQERDMEMDMDVDMDMEEEQEEEEEEEVVPSEQVQAEHLLCTRREVERAERAGRDGAQLRKRRAALAASCLVQRAHVAAHEAAARVAELGLRRTMVDVAWREAARREAALLRVGSLRERRGALLLHPSPR